MTPNQVPPDHGQSSSQKPASFLRPWPKPIIGPYPSPSGTNPFLASKLIDYLGAGKRILGITDLKGTSADILRQFGHFVVSPHDRVGIVQALLQCVRTAHLPVERPVTFTTEHIIRQLANVIHDV